MKPRGAAIFSVPNDAHTLGRRERQVLRLAAVFLGVRVWPEPQPLRPKSPDRDPCRTLAASDAGVFASSHARGLEASTFAIFQLKGF